MSAQHLREALDVAARPLRGLSGLARLLPAVAGGVGCAAVAAWLVRGGVLDGPVTVLLLWAVVAVVLAAGLVAARHAIRALGPWHVAEELEARGAWRRGALTTVLDGAAPGTSAMLHGAADAARAAEVQSRAADALGPVLAVQSRRARLAAGLVLVGGVALVLAQPLRGAPLRLWQPITAWRALTAPVRLVARDSSVARGDAATLSLEAVGQRRAVLSTRSPGEAWRRVEIALDADGRATVTTPPLAAELTARLEAGGRSSEDVVVRVRLPAFLGALTLTAAYPRYLGLPEESLALTGDTLVVPAGTVLRLQGRATTPVATARLASAVGGVALTVAGEAFRGEVTPLSDATYALQVTPVGGGALEGEPPTFAVRVVPDSAPEVELPVPGADTVAPVSLRLPLVIALRDDHGLREASLEARRGAAGTVTRLPIALPPGTIDRALLTSSLDLAALGLRAGDTLIYAAVASDNAPAARRGRSREFRVRIPTEAEQRQARTRETGATATGLDSLVTQARQAQRQTEDLARERPRAPNAGGSGETDPLALETARKAEAAAQAQERVMQDAAQMQQQVEALRQAAEREGLADSALAAQLGEIRDLLDQAMSPEMRAQLAELREALNQLDATKTREALQSLSAQQERSKSAIEQARELFKRAALETSLATMAEEAKQLATAQRDLTEQLGGRDSTAAARAEQALAKRADSLASALDRAAEKVPAKETAKGLQAAADQAREAGAQMQQASRAAAEGKRSAAQQQAKQAEGKLEELDDQIREEREKMQVEMREETVRALDRALAETARLATRQVAVAEAFRRGMPVATVRAEQALLAEGVGKLVDQAVAAGATNALVSPQIAAAFAAARQAMRGAIDAISTATPNYRGAAELSGEGVDALNVAAFSLLRSRDKVSGSESGSGMEEMMEQMQQMAGKQGQLAQEAQGMMQQGQGGVQEMMMQLAMQQRALAQQLERMRSQGQMPGAGALAQEAKELARTLEAGRLDRETVQRQDRLFRKMLDAGRTLQGEEKDDMKERQSTAAAAGALRRPDALDPRLRSGADDIRLPGWEALQRLSPDERRRVLEYFRLLSGGAP
jgi:hypothetical protein